jgi:predicted KAP-like P-loop ATPase
MRWRRSRSIGKRYRNLLRLIEKELAGSDGEKVVVKFDAWLYQNFDDARAALMETIASSLFEAAKDNETLLNKVKRFAKRVNYLRLAGVAVDVGATIMGVPTFGAVTKRHTPIMPTRSIHRLSQMIARQGQ